jgi:protein-tyrosine phosphatase
MIDTHCHLIPNIDDGSDGIESSLAQMKLMAEGGVREAFLTSHFFRGHYQYPREEYDRKLQELQNLADRNGILLKLHPGFEVYLQPNVLEDIQNFNLVLGSSRYVLLESDLNGLPNDFYTQIFPILRKGYKPILAHAERYVSIMKHPKDASHMIERNIYIQVNTGSLLGFYGEKVKETAWNLLRNGWVHLLASDDHVRGPYTHFFKALEQVESEIDRTTVELLTDKYPSHILRGQDIPYRYVFVPHPYHRHHKKRSLKSRIKRTLYKWLVS